MDAPSRAQDNPPDGLRRPWVLLLVLCGAAGLFAWCWTAWVIPLHNSDMRGDLPHHAIMIYEQTLEQSRWPGLFQGYPRLSHALAAWLMPCFDHDPYKAARAVSFASVFVLFAIQYVLLRRVIAGRWALLVLLAWQCVCYETMTSNVHFYHTAFFYAQGVGTVGVWLALLLTTTPAPTSWGRVLLTGAAMAAATFAFYCHTVPGVIAWGTIGVHALLELMRRPTRVSLGILLLVGLTGMTVLFGSEAFYYMVGIKQVGGWMPTRRPWLLVLWVPTLAAAVFERVRGSGAGPRERLLDGLTALLFTAGLIQAYCFWGWMRGTVSDYSVNKLFFVTFPAAALLWALWFARGLEQLAGRRTGAAWIAGARRWPGRVVLACVLLTLAVRISTGYVNTELRGTRATAATNPIRASENLLRHGDQVAGCIYFDPRFRNGTIFINTVGLGHHYQESVTVMEVLSGWKDGHHLGKLKRVHTVLLPADVKPAAVFGAPLRGTLVGSWQEFPLGEVVQALAKK